MFGFFKKIQKAVRMAKVPVVKNPVISNKGGGDGSRFDPAVKLFARPRPSGKKVSPRGSKLRVPKSVPTTYTPGEPYTRELRVTPRNISRVLDRTLPRPVRRRKEQD